MANRNSPQFPPLRKQVSNIPKLGIEILLGLPEHLPQPEMTPSLLAPQQSNDIFLGLYYRVNVEALNDWATGTRFMKWSSGIVVQEPEITDDYKQFLIIMFGSNWEKRVLVHQTMIIEQLYALYTGYGKLTRRLKRVWLDQFDPCSRTVFRAQIKGLAESGGFL